MGKIGVKVPSVALDLPAMMGFKDKTVKELTQGVEFLFKKNKVAYLKGAGTLLGGGKVSVALSEGGEETVSAKNIVIATGSDVARLPGIEIDEETIVSSTGALALKEVPKHLLVIGGGVIGLELGSVWQRLGAQVTVVEFMDHIVPGMDLEVSKAFRRILEKQGLVIRTSTKVSGVKKGRGGYTVTLEPAAGGEAESLKCDHVLVSVGRRPYTEGLGLENAGLTLDERGRIPVDPHYQTPVAGIYAIGDVIAGPMLAHKAEEEGVACIERIAGLKGHVDYDAIPSVVYTQPELAAVGKTEEQLKAEGVPYKVGKFPFTANAKAKTNGKTDGFVKILAHAETDRFLGCHIIGSDAGNMIAEAVLAIEFQGTAEDVALACHAHPTLTEAMKEAALAVHGRAIHI
jgi:dihydrolipoamide dehydrogenase